VALLARRAVGDHPHRVERLLGAPGGDDHMARQRPTFPRPSEYDRAAPAARPCAQSYQPGG
jgi:hypothetical protein